MKQIQYFLEASFEEIDSITEKKEDILYFDIETTGLSSETSALYLIGLIYYKDDKPFYFGQFAESKIDEKELILEMQKILASKKILVCYNGSSFDLPFLRKKAEHYDISLPLEEKYIIDFYRILKPLKQVLQLENRKQFTFEQYIGIQREADLSGKELIPLYFSYLKRGDDDKNEIFSKLMKHNEYDLSGLYALTKLYHFLNQLLSSTKYKENIHVSKSNEKEISLSLSLPFVPKFVSKKDGILLEGDSDLRMITLTLSLLSDELKLFYSDYKNYYYLPKEDNAVHKELSKYMDKNYRVKAEAKTAYSRRRDTFLKLPKEGRTLFAITFKKAYEEKAHFIRLIDFLNYPAKEEVFLLYLKEFFN